MKYLTGAELEQIDREFDARYLDQNGKINWDQVYEDRAKFPDSKPKRLAGIHAEMMERLREEALKRKQQEGNKDTSDNAT